MTKSNTLGAKWYMDQNIFVQTVGALGVSTPTTNGVPVSGASQIVTAAWAAAAVLNAGDIISFVSTDDASQRHQSAIVREHRPDDAVRRDRDARPPMARAR